MDIIETTRKLLETQFTTYWSANGGGVPIAWENAPFQQPSAGTWVMFSIRFASAEQASLGSKPLEFQHGLIFVQIFTPKDSGTRTAAQLSDKVAAALRYQQFKEGGVTVDTYSAGPVPVGERNDYYQLNVSIGFRAQQVVP